MTRIDFYVLSDDSQLNRLLLICRLAEKACQRNQAVFIHADDAGLLADVDTELWQFRANSFVAHQLLDADAAPDSADHDPVHLSTGEPGTDRRVLINLATRVPPFFSRFERTLEVVNQQEAIRDYGRERYRFYRQRGYPLQHHKM